MTGSAGCLLSLLSSRVSLPFVLFSHLHHHSNKGKSVFRQSNPFSLPPPQSQYPCRYPPRPYAPQTLQEAPAGGRCRYHRTATPRGNSSGPPSGFGLRHGLRLHPHHLYEHVQDPSIVGHPCSIFHSAPACDRRIHPTTGLDSTWRFPRAFPPSDRRDDQLGRYARPPPSYQCAEPNNTTDRPPASSAIANPSTTSVFSSSHGVLDYCRLARASVPPLGASTRYGLRLGG